MSAADVPSSDSAPLNGDTGARAAAHTAQMEWQPSPSGTVFRKRVHRVGPPESGQVTSVVRYEPGASFPAHDHPEGEEILVLAGVFSDEHGDWPAGTYLLNPEGFHHAPFSKEGCEIFVKLRQYAGDRRVHVATPTGELAWEPTGDAGIDRKPLYSGAEVGAPDAMFLERWQPGARRDARRFEGGVEIFVVRGMLVDEDERYEAGSWLRLPPGRSHGAASPEGCELYVKTGGVAALRTA